MRETLGNGRRPSRAFGTKALHIPQNARPLLLRSTVVARIVRRPAHGRCVAAVGLVRSTVVHLRSTVVEQSAHGAPFDRVAPLEPAQADNNGQTHPSSSRFKTHR